MKKTLLLVLLLPVYALQAQIPDHVYHPSIHSVKLYRYGDIYGYPMIKLHSGDLLELHFDDLEGGVKFCYYTFQHCNADWTPSALQYYDYTKGFQSTRITTYRNSSISITNYTHYMAVLPDKNAMPTRSGNYMLKVFLNNDTADLLFTKRFIVVDNRVSIAAQMLRPFSGQLANTDQRVQVAINTASSQINTLSPQDLKLVVLQNNIWPTAARVDRPSIYRGNYYEYNDDATTFPAGREWRWIDVRSMRLMSERMQKIVDTAKRIEIYVKADSERKGILYFYYRDLNGLFTIENMDGNNPFWQSDYGYVHFTFVPPGNQAYAGKDIYIFGELTNYVADDRSRMVFNPEKGVYEGTLFLKQGYYNYNYVTVDARDNSPNRFSLASTEGNFNMTENNYTVLVYYRPFGGRADELLGMALVNTYAPR